MEPSSSLFASVLQGPYAYLLIVQVLIVTGLMLVFIWLLLYRTREAALNPSTETAEEAATKAAEAAVAAAAAAASAVPMVDATELESERSKTKALSDESKLLHDKVQYLESKLLQYEILQEEISSLSELKQENETLRQEVLKLKGSSGRGGGGAGGASETPSAAAAAAPAATAPVAKPAEETPAVDPNAAERKEPTAMGSAIENASPESLDSLLQQIDQITTQPKS